MLHTSNFIPFLDVLPLILGIRIFKLFATICRFSVVKTIYEQIKINLLYIYFATKHLPPNDENCISLLVQGALSAQATSNWKAVKEYSKKATDIHDLLFGGGVTFFRQRYENEIKLQLRPTSKKVLSGEAAFDLIWKE